MRFLLAACLIALIGCSTTEQSSTSTAGGWSTQYSHNVTLTQSPGGFTFTFPTKDGVHYIVKSASKLSGTITATFAVTGGKFVAAGGGKPRAGLYFQRKGDTMSGAGDYEWYRWWSNPQAVRLVPEIVNGNHTFVLTAPLQPKYWSSVYGKFGNENVKMFNAAKDNIAVIGFSFGDDFGFGHGVWSVGKATFTLTKFTP